MFKELDEPTNLLDDFQFDYTIHRLKYYTWQNEYCLWRKWLWHE